MTWRDNYKKLSKELGLGDELHINPAKALNKNIAYAIISHGMRNGTFTTSKLSDHISGNRCDYVNARQIINDHDRADEIAEDAEQIELLLRLSAGPTSVPSNPGWLRVNSH